MGVFSTYAEAHAKLDRAQYISDLNSDMSDDGRRKRLPPCRLIQESEEPTIGRTKRPRVFPLPESSDSEDVDNTLPDVPPIPHNFPECHAAGKKTIARPCSSQGSNDDSIHDTISGTLDEMCGTSFAGMSGEATSHPRQHENVASTTEFQKQVLQLLHLVRLTQQRDSAVLHELCAQRVTSTAAKPLGALIKQPFASSEDFEQFDSSLSEERKLLLAQELVCIGGNDVGHATRNILAYMLTNRVAEEYSWFGQKGKKKFCTLHAPLVIFEAIRMNRKFSGATRTEVECSIKSWLRHAKERRCSKE
ncbi:uncharacterized protein LOC135369208 [Ornithodoros turicata]